MSSPVGHSLAGFLGFILIRNSCRFSVFYSSHFLIILAIIVANLPDIDFVLGYLFFGDINAIHRQFTHSFFFGYLACLMIFISLRVLQKVPFSFLVWLWAVYFSHIFLDMLAYDSYPPAGVQCFFPFSFDYFAFPISILGGLSMTGGIIQLNNFLTVLQEIFVIPLLFIVVLFIINQFRKYVKNND